MNVKKFLLLLKSVALGCIIFLFAPDSFLLESLAPKYSILKTLTEEVIVPSLDAKPLLFIEKYNALKKKIEKSDLEEKYSQELKAIHIIVENQIKKIMQIHYAKEKFKGLMEEKITIFFKKYEHLQNSSSQEQGELNNKLKELIEMKNYWMQNVSPKMLNLDLDNEEAQIVARINCLLEKDKKDNLQNSKITNQSLSDFKLFQKKLAHLYFSFLRSYKELLETVYSSSHEGIEEHLKKIQELYKIEETSQLKHKTLLKNSKKLFSESSQKIGSDNENESIHDILKMINRGLEILKKIDDKQKEIMTMTTPEKDLSRNLAMNSLENSLKNFMKETENILGHSFKNSLVMIDKSSEQVIKKLYKLWELLEIELKKKIKSNLLENRNNDDSIIIINNLQKNILDVIEQNSESEKQFVSILNQSGLTMKQIFEIKKILSHTDSFDINTIVKRNNPMETIDKLLFKLKETIDKINSSDQFNQWSQEKDEIIMKASHFAKILKISTEKKTSFQNEETPQEDLFLSKKEELLQIANDIEKKSIILEEQLTIFSSNPKEGEQTYIKMKKFITIFQTDVKHLINKIEKESQRVDVIGRMCSLVGDSLSFDDTLEKKSLSLLLNDSNASLLKNLPHINNPHEEDVITLKKIGDIITSHLRDIKFVIDQTKNLLKEDIFFTHDKIEEGIQLKADIKKLASCAKKKYDSTLLNFTDTLNKSFAILMQKQA